MTSQTFWWRHLTRALIVNLKMSAWPSVFDQKKKKKEKKGYRARNQKFSAKFHAFSKKKKVFTNFPRGFWRSPRQSKKKGHGHGPFLTIQKIVLFSAEDKAFSKICRLRGQGLDHRSQRQGFQNVSSRTPTPLNVLLTSCFWSWVSFVD